MDTAGSERSSQTEVGPREREDREDKRLLGPVGGGGGGGVMHLNS